MTKTLWGGRFQTELSPLALSFNSAENLGLDRKLIPYDIAGNLAHVYMLGEQKILSVEQAKAILKALLEIKKDHTQGRFQLKPELEDVHMNVEAVVTKITPHGKSMHVARSRNDQVILDTRLYLRDRILELAEAIVALQQAFGEAAKNNEIMPAYTHTRVAQPISTEFWANAYVHAFCRDIDRLLELYERVNQNPLGAGACAGTFWNIDRNRTAELLGFSGVQENALDVVSSRGELEAELLAVLSLAMAKLSRLSEELIWFSEKGFVAIPEEFTTGSSMMPQKKNADVLEIIRGRTARVYGNWVHILTALKGLISGYNSDSQETKKALMEGIETVQTSLAVAAVLLGGVRFNEKEMVATLQKNFASATALADLLAQKGIPFREAHAAAGKLVRACEEEGKTLDQLTPVQVSRVAGVAVSKSELEGAVHLHAMRVPPVSAKIQAYAKKIDGKKRAVAQAYEKLFAQAAAYSR